jgi:hypothetical protein
MFEIMISMSKRGLPKIGLPPKHPRVDHFSIETYGFADPLLRNI